MKTSPSSPRTLCRRLSNRASILIPFLLVNVVSGAVSPSTAQPELRADANPSSAIAGRSIQIEKNQLMIDGRPQPQLFGAEIQYFRLRGGYERNQPRAKVIALWNKALDRAVEAKMNAVSFYIPWDFHEYAEGKFDFTGTVDEDGDGRPDYPSRDLITFFKLVEQHGIKRILVRPGPYINAEWGYLGFGAIPSWFHEKYPNSHMMSQDGLRTKLYDYANPDLLKATRRWFTALHQQVLQSRMGVGKPIVFLQLDNETNYQWQSLYAADYSPSAIARYQTYLQATYGDLATLNQTHGRHWTDWGEIQPPSAPLTNLNESRDWYRFADQTIGHYLHEVRKIWESLGVTEPQILFTEAESYNAPQDGLLPNFVLKNAAGLTGLMTVNLYPKTFETSDDALSNTPFKADMDVKAADAANDAYLGSRQEWAMGPEIQGGWWKGIDVTDASRQQTYLTVIGHGLKSFFVYYFNEGDNFGVEWAQQKVRPLYNQLVNERKIQNPDPAQLPDAFWTELQTRSDHQILAGFDVRHLMQSDLTAEKSLYFDAPLNGNADPGQHYASLKRIGTNVIAPHQDFLGRSLEVEDEIAFVKDSTSHAPGPDARINALWANSDWSAGLVGYLLNAGLNPRILHGDLTPRDQFQTPKALFHIDTGLNDQRTTRLLVAAHAKGQAIVNFISDQLLRDIGFNAGAKFMHEAPRALFAQLRKGTPDLGPHAQVDLRDEASFYVGADGGLRSGHEPDAVEVKIKVDGPIYTYSQSLIEAHGCHGLLYWQNEVIGFACPATASSGALVQIGALLFDDYNSSSYASITDALARRHFMRSLMAEFGVRGQISFDDQTQLAVAFARQDPLRRLLWVTVKTGARFEQEAHLTLSAELLQKTLSPAAHYVVHNLLPEGSDEVSQILPAATLTRAGFHVPLHVDGSTVFTIETQ